MQCPMCAEKARFRKRETHSGPGYSYTMMACDACGSHFADPLKEISSEWYEGRYQPRNYPWRWEFDALLSDISRIVSVGGMRNFSLLEIGCGNGILLRGIKGRYPQSRLVGLDFNRWAIGELEGSGIEAYATTLREFSGRDDRTFDFVVFFHLLEHLDDPNGFFADVQKLLNGRGVVFFSIPNIERWNLQFFGHEVKDSPPHHLLRFSRTGLEAILARNGFCLRRYQAEPLRFRDIWTVLSWRFSDVLRFGLASRIAGKNGEGKEVSRKTASGSLVGRESGIRKLRRLLTRKTIGVKESLIPYLVLPYALFFYVWNRSTLEGKSGHALYIVAERV